MNVRKLLSLTILLLASFLASQEVKAQVTAASCSQTDVQAAFNTATTGQTVTIPAGSCSWSAVTLNKSITVQGAGQGITNVDLGVGSSALHITKVTAGPIRFQNMTFTVS